MIRAYVGLQGSGKTLSMVRDATYIMDKKLRVVSNVPFHTKKFSAIHLEGKAFFEDLLHPQAINTLYVIDEGGVVFGKYSWKEISTGVQHHIIMHRKFGQHIFFGTPSYQDVAVQLRTYVAQAVACKKVKFPLISFTNIFYNPVYFEFKKQDLTPALERQYVIKRRFISTTEAHRLYKLYDTKYIVDATFLSKIKKQQVPAGANERIIGRYL